MSKKVVIGKNSKIVNLFWPLLQDAVAISHTEVGGFDFSDYEFIIVFSWSHSCLEDNLNLVKSIPLNKAVFISTVAVLSLQFRSQWSKYPIWKKLIEDYVLAGGGRVLRLGICDPEIKKWYYGWVPITNLENLALRLNHCEDLNRQITHVFDLERGGLQGAKQMLGRALNHVSGFLPSFLIFQGGIAILLKLLRIYNYGYTGDAFRFFNETLLVGYGVLGAAYSWENNKSLINVSVVVSYDDNKRLDDSGFKNTLIGYYKNGLGRTWHGVSVSQVKEGYFKKNVPFFNKRPNPPSGHLKGNVKEFVIDNDLIVTVIEHLGGSFLFFSSKIVLAAGPIENIRILQKGDAILAKLSDHEVGMLGTIDCNEAVDRELLARRAWLVSPAKVLVQELAGLKVLMDFRPFVGDKHSSNEKNGAFYLDSTRNLVLKLLLGFSFSRINEAIFNKFGFGFETKRISVCCQILVENAVDVHPDGTLSRVRIPEHRIRRLQELLGNDFSTFVPDQDPALIDSQHLFGGGDMLCSSKYNGYLLNGKIAILGSPTNWRLGATHHTTQVSASIKSGLYNPLDRVELI